MKRSTTQKNAGKMPNFSGEILRFKVTSEKSMKVIVYDEENLKAKHDHVGDGTIDLDRILAGHVKKQTIEIKHKGKSAGVVNLEFDLMNQMAANVGGKLLAGINLQGIPNAQPQAPMPMQMQPPNPYYQPQPMQQQMMMKPQPMGTYGMMAQNVGQGLMTNYGIAAYQQGA